MKKKICLLVMSAVCFLFTSCLSFLYALAGSGSSSSSSSSSNSYTASSSSRSSTTSSSKNYTRKGEGGFFEYDDWDSFYYYLNQARNNHYYCNVYVDNMNLVEGLTSTHISMLRNENMKSYENITFTYGKKQMGSIIRSLTARFHNDYNQALISLDLYGGKLFFLPDETNQSIDYWNYLLNNAM